MKQEVDLPTRYRFTQVILMKQEVDSPTRYIITHVILMKQEIDLPTRYSNYTGNSDETRGRFTY
jgi:hypothetical protein